MIKKAVVTAGGPGTRLRPVTYEIPKPLLTVKKKPILNYLLNLFADYGIREVAILASRRHEEDFTRWQKTLDSRLPRGKVSIFFEEKPRGTFGGMREVQAWLRGEQFIFSNGDELKEFNLKNLIEFHETHRPVGTIALVKVENPKEYGVPVMSGNHIRQFLEKPDNPPSNYISSGLYILDPAVFGYADFSKDFLMIERDIFPQVAAHGKLMGLKMEGARWYDCGNLERWEKAIKEW